MTVTCTRAGERVWSRGQAEGGRGGAARSQRVLESAAAEEGRALLEASRVRERGDTLPHADAELSSSRGTGTGARTASAGTPTLF